jgi:hypothetical protein
VGLPRLARLESAGMLRPYASPVDRNHVEGAGFDEKFNTLLDYISKGSRSLKIAAISGNDSDRDLTCAVNAYILNNTLPSFLPWVAQVPVSQAVILRRGSAATFVFRESGKRHP